MNTATSARASSAVWSRGPDLPGEDRAADRGRGVGRVVVDVRAGPAHGARGARAAAASDSEWSARRNQVRWTASGGGQSASRRTPPSPESVTRHRGVLGGGRDDPAAAVGAVERPLERGQRLAQAGGDARPGGVHPGAEDEPRAGARGAQRGVVGELPGQEDVLEPAGHRHVDVGAGHLGDAGRVAAARPVRRAGVGLAQPVLEEVDLLAGGAPVGVAQGQHVEGVDDGSRRPRSSRVAARTARPPSSRIIALQDSALSRENAPPA